MADLIDRQTAIETAIEAADKWDGGYSSEREGIIRKFFDKVPAVQPDHTADSGKKVERTDETAQNVQNEDLISRKWLVECIEEGWVKFDTAKDCNRMMHLVRDIAPSVQPEHTCVNCGRTANNGGWYADGRTRCPIEEHYALPKDGYCHLWEKRNVTDDDYPERREDERPES